MPLAEPLDFIRRHILHPLTVEAEDARAIDPEADKDFEWRGRTLTLDWRVSDILLSLCTFIFAPITYYYLTAQRKLEMLPKYRALVIQLDQVNVPGTTPEKVNAVAVKALNRGFEPAPNRLQPVDIFRHALAINDAELALEAFELILDPEVIRLEYLSDYDESIFVKLLLRAHQLGLKSEEMQGVRLTPLYSFLAHQIGDMVLMHNVNTYQSKQRMQYAKRLSKSFLKNILGLLPITWLQALLKRKQCFGEAEEAGFRAYINQLNERSDENADQLNIMHYAAQMEWPEAYFHFLMDVGGDIHSRDGDGLTPLHWACGCGKLETAKYLIQQGAKLDVVSNLASKRRPIFSAMVNRKEDIVDYILQHHNPEAYTLGQMAVMDNSAEMLNYLIENGKTNLAIEGDGLRNLARERHAAACLEILGASAPSPA